MNFGGLEWVPVLLLPVLLVACGSSPIDSPDSEPEPNRSGSEPAGQSVVELESDTAPLLQIMIQLVKSFHQAPGEPSVRVPTGKVPGLVLAPSEVIFYFPKQDPYPALIQAICDRIKSGTEEPN